MSNILEDSFVFLVVVVVILTISYILILNKFFTFSAFCGWSFFFLTLYFTLKSEKYQDKYNAPFIVGNGISHSVLSHRIKDVSSIIPNHHLIFLGGYVDSTLGGEMLGREGVLLIDSSHYWVYGNKSVALHPDLIKKPVRIPENKKYNPIRQIIQDEVGTTYRVYLTIDKNIKSSIKMPHIKDIVNLDSKNVTDYISILSQEVVNLSEMLDGNFNYLRKIKSKMTDITETKKGWFQRKPKTEEE